MASVTSSAALIVGSTGAVGRQVLAALLSSSESSYSTIYELGRRKTEYPVNGVETPAESALSKLKSLVAPNEAFESKETLAEHLKEANGASTVFITLGTTRADAGGAEPFIKIDQEYVVNAAKAAKSATIDQKLLYCSSRGADSSSSFLYTRSKGETEERLSSLGYRETIIFRPGMLQVRNGRDKPRLAERAFGIFTRNVLSHFSAEAEIDTDVLGKAMLRAANLGIAQLLHHHIGHKEPLGKSGIEALVLTNGDAVKLAKLDL